MFTVAVILALIAAAASFLGGPSAPLPDRLGDYAYQVAGGTDAELPLVVVLHPEDTNPADVIKVVAEAVGPARVIVPFGRVPTKGGLSYVDPAISGETLFKALRDEAVRLQDFLALAEARFPTRHRAIVVGVGTSGMLAVALGLGAQPLVRRAFGVGGVFAAAWVPLATVYKTVVRKLSWGDAVGTDKLAEQTAQQRGFDYVVDVADIDALTDAPDVDTTRAWLLKNLLDNLETP